MTKRELIEALEATNCSDDTKVAINHLDQDRIEPLWRERTVEKLPQDAYLFIYSEG